MLRAECLWTGGRSNNRSAERCTRESCMTATAWQIVIIECFEMVLIECQEDMSVKYKHVAHPNHTVHKMFISPVGWCFFFC